MPKKDSANSLGQFSNISALLVPGLDLGSSVLVVVVQVLSCVQLSREPHGLRHARPLCPSLSLRICSNCSPVGSVPQSCLTLCDPMDCSMPGYPIHHQFPERTHTHVHKVSDAIQPSLLCHPLLLLPSIFPSIRVFSNELVLHIRWSKYWSFSFSISPSNE